MTSKERAELKARAMKMESIFQIGKASLTTQNIDAIKSALKARELIKINVLKNCMDDPAELAQVVAERTGSQIVQVIGKKIILYKKNPQKEEKRRRLKQRQKTAQKKRRQEQKAAAKEWSRADSMEKKKKAEKRKKSQAGSTGRRGW